MLLDELNKIELQPTVPVKEVTYIPRIGALISIFNIILGIISIVLIVLALKKNKDKKILAKWIIMYIISAIIRAIPEIMFICGISLDYNPAFWNIYGMMIFNVITLVIRVVMVIYPIYIIRKNKKENK